MERGQGECGEEDKTREERDGWLKERGGRDAPQGHVAKPPASHLQAETDMRSIYWPQKKSSLILISL